jgi:hypothetical protein
MNQLYPLRIDAYSHIIPRKYGQILEKLVPDEYNKKIAPSPVCGTSKSGSAYWTAMENCSR